LISNKTFRPVFVHLSGGQLFSAIMHDQRPSPQ
jgi:hypothetical protein